jgi:hypothetical protein
MWNAEQQSVRKGSVVAMEERRVNGEVAATFKGLGVFWEKLGDGAK